MVLYCAVSSPLDCSKRFTLSSPGRPVHSDTVLGFSWKHSSHAAIRLFANDVIMIGSVRADWPAPFSVTIGNPRADKLGRNGFEYIGRRCLVDRERCVRATFMHSAIDNYSMLHLQRWLECRGIKRFGTKSLFMIISHNCQSCMCRQ